MKRNLFLLPLILLFAISLSAPGCGSNQAEFEETAMPDSEQEAEAESYQEQMEADAQRMKEAYK